MAGSIDIYERLRRAKEVAGIGSSANSVEDGVGGSLSIMFAQISCSKVKDYIRL